MLDACLDMKIHTSAGIKRNVQANYASLNTVLKMIKKYKCNTCNKTNQSSEEIENHNKSKHSFDQKENINNEGDESEPEAENEEAVPTCLQCGQIYDDVDDLINHHMDTYHNMEEDERLE